MISQSEAPAPEEIVVHKNRRYTSSLSAATGETYLTGGTRVSTAPENTHRKEKEKYKIPSFISIYSWK